MGNFQVQENTFKSKRFLPSLLLDLESMFGRRIWKNGFWGTGGLNPLFYFLLQTLQFSLMLRAGGGW